jgi:hypothetical protein
MQHDETGLLCRRNPPPPQRAVHNVHDFIMAQRAQLMGGTAGEGVLSVCRAELSTAKARSGLGSMGEVGLPKAPPQGSPEVAVREAQWVSSGQGLQPGRRRPARNAPQPGRHLHAGFWGSMIDFADELVKQLLGLVACDGRLKIAQGIVLAGLREGFVWGTQARGTGLNGVPHLVKRGQVRAVKRVEVGRCVLKSQLGQVSGGEPCCPCNTGGDRGETTPSQVKGEEDLLGGGARGEGVARYAASGSPNAPGSLLHRVIHAPLVRIEGPRPQQVRGAGDQ